MPHMPTRLLVGFSHKMSDLPSPLKSPMPAMFIVVDPWPTSCQVGTLLFICHAPTRLLVGFCHRISEVPSPLKSPMPATLMVDEPLPTTCHVATLFSTVHRPTLDAA